jgi:hypothetical protein
VKLQKLERKSHSQVADKKKSKYTIEVMTLQISRQNGRWMHSKENSQTKQKIVTGS